MLLNAIVFLCLFELQIHKTVPMPVPSSYNDISEDNNLRDHVGTVWYDRKFFVSASWAQNKRVWIRFGSVHYEAYVVSNAIKCNNIYFICALSLSRQVLVLAVNMFIYAVIFRTRLINW